MFWCELVLVYLPISFTDTGDCPHASEVTLKDMGKCITWIHKNWYFYQNYTKQYELIPFFMLYIALLSAYIYNELVTIQ